MLLAPAAVGLELDASLLPHPNKNAAIIPTRISRFKAWTPARFAGEPTHRSM